MIPCLFTFIKENCACFSTHNIENEYMPDSGSGLHNVKELHWMVISIVIGGFFFN
jgi:hypothetical protein